MSDPYAFARERTAGALSRLSTGTVTLTRVTRADPDPSTPWKPGAVTSTAVYTLDARADGTAGEYADGSTVLAADRMVIASPRATLNGAAVEIIPEMTDTLTIEGEANVIKRIDAVPAAGAAVRFHIFVAGGAPVAPLPIFVGSLDFSVPANSQYVPLI